MTSTQSPTPHDAPAASAPGAAALHLDSVTKGFPGVIALSDVSLRVVPGEVHALVGENGAGKSTLMSVAAGVVKADLGSVTVGGELVPDPTPARMRDLGVAVVYQRPALPPDLTVAENLVLGVPVAARPALRRSAAWASQRMQHVGLDVDPRSRVADLSVAERHLLEIAKAFACDPKVLVLDEPTEPLSQEEGERLFSLVRAAADRGVAIVYISHRLRDVERIADRLTVLRDGRCQGTFDVGELTEDDILRLIVGRAVDTAYPTKGVLDGGDPLLRLDGFSGKRFGPVDLTMQAGEVVGLAGIEGNGQRDLMRALAGLEHSEGGVVLENRALAVSRPGAAMAAGVAYMPADRHREGLMLDLSVRENMLLTTLGRHATAGVVVSGREFATVADRTSAFGVKAASPETPVRSLSGGNQQKTVFARTLLSGPRLILADEPTQGVDAGARMELYRHLRSAADDGAAVVVLSSDALELAGLCDRVLVFSRGHVVAELGGEDVTEEQMTHAALTSTQVRRSDEAPVSRGTRLTGLLAGDLAPAALLAFLALVLGAYTATRSDAYLSTANFQSFLGLLSILGFIALGQFVVIVLGGIDLSVGPLAGFLVVVASAVVSEPGFSSLLGIALLALLAVAFGATNGVLVRKIKVTPVIATLVTFFILQGLSLTVRPTPGGIIDLGISDALQSAVGFVPVALLVLLAAVALLEWRLRYSSWGLELRAVGSDESAAHRLGIRTDRVHVRAYVLCSVLTFLGALLLMAQLGVGDASAGVEFTLASIAAVVIGGASIFGGRGTAIGVLMGAVLLQQITNVSPFLQLGSAWQYWLVGGLTLLAAGVYFRARRAA